MRSVNAFEPWMRYLMEMISERKRTPKTCAMKAIFISAVLAVFMLAGWPATAVSQSDSTLLSNVTEEEQAAINALVLYPEATRRQILDASLYPELLIKLENIQANTRTSFTELLSPLPQTTQEQIWDLTRYPGLIAQLVALSRTDREGLQTVLAAYPEAIRTPATLAFDQHWNTLAEIERIETSATAALNTVLESYPAAVQESFQTLTGLPEVLSLLTENLRLTILLGDQYRTQPDWVVRKLDSLNLVVARNNARELEDWKENLEASPEIAAELGYAAETYREEETYDDLYYDPASAEYDPVVSEEADRVVEEVPYYYDYPYPYWFGYPYWYDYPRWRPYPLWYEWGFVYRPTRGLVVFRLPSYHFVYWYFDHPYHHVWWPRLSATFVRHYHHHRYYTSGITTGVGSWRRYNRTVITDRWLRDDGQLVNRFREYGDFEVDRRRYNERRPNRALAPRAYLERNTRRYPELSRTAPRTTAPRTTAPRTQSRPDATRGQERTTPPRTTAPRTRTTPTRPEPRAVPRTVPRTRGGEEYHRNTARRTRTARPEPPRATRTAPRTETSRKSAPRKTRKPTPPPKRSGGGF